VAAPISATPSVPTEPQDVPVQSDITAVTKNAERTNRLGLSSRMPAEMSAGMVPEATQVPISMPMVSRIRMTGSTAASFSPVDRWMSPQVEPRSTACVPATPAATSRATTSISAPRSKKIPPTAKQASSVTSGSEAAAAERGARLVSGSLI